MNNIINTPQNNQKNNLNPKFQSQQKKVQENNIYKKLVAQCNSKTIDAPKGVLLKNNGPIKGLAIGIADTGKDVVNLTRALKDGKTNDHSLGRMNDLGLKVGGLGIAAYLMTKKGPKTAKMMELVGLGTFLATMSLWPRVFVDLPLRLRYGFNIRQKYQDSQGRKKEFFQDNQYLPWDLWPQEKIDKVGDRMGIPRNIKDRDSFTQRNMQKVALQGNTLWMLSAGLATPLVTSMACKGTEKVLENINIERQYNKMASAIESPEAITKAANSRAKSMNPFVRIFGDSTAKGKGGESWINRLVNIFSPIRNSANFHDADSAKVASTVVSPNNPIRGDLTRIWDSNVRKFIDEDTLSGKLSEIFKNGIPIVDDTGEVTLSKLSAEEIQTVVKTAKLENSKGGLGEALAKAFGEFFKGRDGASLDSKTFGNSIREISGSDFVSIDEKGATEVLSGAYDDIIRVVKAKLDIVQEAMNATMGNRAESITTQAYKQTLRDVLAFVNPNMKQLKEAGESPEKAYELVLNSLQEIGQDETKFRAFIGRLAKTSDSGTLLNRLGRRVVGIFGGSAGYSSPNERLDEVISRVRENGYQSLRESAEELRAHGFEEYAKLFDENNTSGIFRAFDDTMELAKINLNSTSARYVMAIDLENKLRDPGFVEGLERFAKSKGLEVKDCIETCRKMIITDNMNDLMIKNSIFDKDAYYLLMNIMFGNKHNQKTFEFLQKEGYESLLDSKTFEFLQEEGYEDLLDAVDRTRSSMLSTGTGANYHPMSAISNRDDMLAVFGGQSQRYGFTGETVPEFFSKAANEAYKNKKWMRIFGTATVALIGATLLTQFFFGRRNDKNLYEKKEKEVKNVNKR